MTRSGPLVDLRVLDLTHHIAGPFCTRLFADYGADVVKVERPAGDPLRSLGPLFAYFNAGKRSVTLDLATPHGREAVLDLARDSDVVVESFRPGRLARFGLTHEALREANPRLVLCSISNFGQTGPYRDYAATELVLQAMSGLTYGSGEPEREPLWTPLHLAQQAAGVMAYLSSLAAIRHARVAGEGLTLDVSIHESLMELQELMMAAWFYSGSIRQRMGHRRETNHPANILPSKDGYVPMLVVLPRDWQALAELIGRPDMARDPRFATGPARAQHADEIDAVLVPWLAERTGEEVYRLAQEQRIPVSRVLDAAGILASPHLRERGFFREVDGLTMPGLPFKATPPPGEGHDRHPEPAKGPAITAAGKLARPLDGVRIVDLTHVWAGPKCTQILADLGAEVIKIEAPTRTDPARGATNLLGLERYPNRERGDKPYDRNGYFNTTSRNKHGISLDLRQERGRDVFRRLVQVSHAVVENFSAGVMDRLGLGYAELKATNPGIILVSMSGFGAVGPDSRSPAWAETVEAMGGLPALTGYAGGPPTLTFQAVSDPIGGLFGAAAVLTALHHQRQTGEGQFVDLSQQEALLCMSPEPLLEYAATGRLRERAGNSHPRMAPHAIFACCEPDTWVAIAVRDDAAWVRLRDMADGPAGIDGPRFDTLAGRLAARRELEAAIEGWTRSLTQAEVTRRLQAVCVASGPVLNVAQLTTDAHSEARGLFQEIDHEEVGPYSYYVPAPIRFGTSALAARKGAPRFGADNHDILRRVVGLSEAEVAELAEAAVISSRPLEAILRGDHR